MGNASFQFWRCQKNRDPFGNRWSRNTPDRPRLKKKTKKTQSSTRKKKERCCPPFTNAHKFSTVIRSCSTIELLPTPVLFWCRENWRKKLAVYIVLQWLIWGMICNGRCPGFNARSKESYGRGATWSATPVPLLGARAARRRLTTPKFKFIIDLVWWLCCNQDICMSYTII